MILYPNKAIGRLQQGGFDHSVLKKVLSVFLFVVDSKYVQDPNGLIVRNTQFSDSGIYECFGSEQITGATIPKVINVEVVSK